MAGEPVGNKSEELIEANLLPKPRIVSIPADISSVKYGWTAPLSNEGGPINSGKGTPATTSTKDKAAVNVSLKKNQTSEESQPTVKASTQLRRAFKLETPSVNQLDGSDKVLYSSMGWWAREWVDYDCKIAVTTAPGYVLVRGKNKGKPTGKDPLWACIREIPSEEDAEVKVKIIFCLAISGVNLSYWKRPLTGDETVAWEQLGSNYDLTTRFGTAASNAALSEGSAYRMVRYVALNKSRTVASVWLWERVASIPGGNKDLILDINLENGAVTTEEPARPITTSGTVTSGNTITITNSYVGSFAIFLEYNEDVKLYTTIEIDHTNVTVEDYTSSGELPEPENPPPNTQYSTGATFHKERNEEATYTLTRGAFTKVLKQWQLTKIEDMEDSSTWQAGYPTHGVVASTLTYTAEQNSTEQQSECFYLTNWGQLYVLCDRGPRTRNITTEVFRSMVGSIYDGTTELTVSSQVNNLTRIHRGTTTILDTFTNPGGSETDTWTTLEINNTFGDFGLQYELPFPSSDTTTTAKTSWTELFQNVGSFIMPYFKRVDDLTNTEWMNERSVGEFSIYSVYQLKKVFWYNEYGPATQQRYVPDDTKVWNWSSQAEHIDKYLLEGDDQMLKNLHII
jgi:hypothetical protein